MINTKIQNDSSSKYAVRAMTRQNRPDAGTQLQPMSKTLSAYTVPISTHYTSTTHNEGILGVQQENSAKRWAKPAYKLFRKVQEPAGDWQE